MPHILFLMSDTGGGHRAAGTAIINALEDIDGVTTSMVDFLVETARPPFNRIGVLYRPTINYAPWLWAGGFYATNNVVVRYLTERLLHLTMAGGMFRLLRERPADLIVSVHPLATDVPARVLKTMRSSVPFVVVVTDLYTAHPLWFTPRANHYFVPTEEVQRLALLAGLRTEQITVSGLPIDPAFTDARPDARDLKLEYGLDPDRPLVLLMGGGEGMGPLEEQAETLAGAGIPITLMVITGRNERLRRRLEARDWSVPIAVTGFVCDVPRRMAAADVIVTKAGPGTLSEALAAHQPILISDYIPGQERGNVDWIVSGGAGRFVPTLSELGNALCDLFEMDGTRTESYRAMAAAARRMAHPDAAYTIAQQLVRCVHCP